jgi:hypothetical protein
MLGYGRRRGQGWSGLRFDFLQAVPATAKLTAGYPPPDS